MAPLVYSPLYVVDVGDHVFPTRKFGLVARALRGEGELVEPEAPTREQLRAVHTEAWVDKVLEARLSLDEETLVEMRVSPEVARAHALAVGGTLLACRRALDAGVGLHVGGGSHHAFPGHGEGFCLLNDIACAIRALQAEGRLRRAAVVDLDVHHGNGTAACFAGDPGVFTFSMHQDGIYPERRPPSSLDVGLAAGTGDAEYLARLEAALPLVLAHRPELVVYQAGVDCAEGDLLGGLSLSPKGLRMRDRAVRKACQGAGVPVAVTLGGGYAARLEDTAALHVQTLRLFSGHC